MMVVSELISYLRLAQEKHGDIPVFGAWEGISRDVAAVYIDEHDGPIAEIAVYLDVDYGLPPAASVIDVLYSSLEQDGD